ncbi:MAG: penicillin-binding protein 2 [Chloroflexi bacterium]|nr:penicillin-binding protein 2 [Chloroflexota bacterium]
MPAATGHWRARMYLLGALFLGCACVLVYRLYSFQYLQHDYYRQVATAEHRETLKVVPRRGAILDTNGNPLAITVMFDAVEVVGKQVQDPEKTALALAPILEMRPADILVKIDRESNRAVTLKDQLPAAVADQIDTLGLPGVSLTQEPFREYPEGPIASQILGFLGTDRDGLAGLEYRFEQDLAGEPGEIDTELDITRQELILARRVVKPPREGTDIILTLDRYVQRTLERELAEAVRQNKASGGMIIAMEPATGAVLGMAAWPTFTVDDPMVFRADEAQYQKPIAVTNQYEPGSVMKLVTMAGALDQHVVTPNTTVNDTGIVTFPGTPPVTIRNWDLRANGVITTTEILVRSANVGTHYVAQMLGKDLLYRYFADFGFGQKTGIELPGEVPGTVRTPDMPGWTIVDQTTNAFGQGIAVTPIQMLSAVAAIGNNGVLMQPTLIKGYDRSGEVEWREPRQVRRVISVDAARTLRDMMVTVDEQPGLQPYRIPGIRVAAKTGTADYPTDLGYTSGKTFASMVALMPAEQPRLAILVRLDAPEAIYGGVVAAPVLQRVGSELLTYYRIPTQPVGR